MKFSHASILRIEASKHLLGPPPHRTFLMVTTDGVIDPMSTLGRDIREAAIYDWIVLMKRAKETDVRLVAGERLHA